MASTRLNGSGGTRRSAGGGSTGGLLASSSAAELGVARPHHRANVFTLPRDRVNFDPVSLTADQIASLPELDLEAAEDEGEALAAFMARAALAWPSTVMPAFLDKGLGGPKLRF